MTLTTIHTHQRLGVHILLFEPLVRSFASFDDALRAQQALIDSGIDPDRVELRVIQDEAGPVEGNFVAGNGRSASGAGAAGAEAPYEQNFERTVTRGVHLLMVDVKDPVAQERAQGILSASGGVDPQARADDAA